MIKLPINNTSIPSHITQVFSFVKWRGWGKKGEIILNILTNAS